MIWRWRSITGRTRWGGRFMICVEPGGFGGGVSVVAWGGGRLWGGLLWLEERARRRERQFSAALRQVL